MRTSVQPQIFAEETTFPKNRMRCIRTERFKLIRNIDTSRKTTAGICGPRPIEGSGDHYFVDRPAFELYDVENDPHELANLAGQSDYATVQADLAARLESWMRETDDPVLSGGEERPPGEAELKRFQMTFVDNGHTALLWD